MEPVAHALARGERSQGLDRLVVAAAHSLSLGGSGRPVLVPRGASLARAPAPWVVHAEVPRRVRRLVVPPVPRRELLREHGDDVRARVSRLDVADEIEGVRDDESGAVAGEDVVAGRRRTIEEVGVGVGVRGWGRAGAGGRHAGLVREEMRGGRRTEMRGRLPPTTRHRPSFLVARYA